MVSELTGGITPYEALFGRKPSAKHWGVFGCNAYYHISRQVRGASLAPKMEPCIYLGHDSIQNCASVWSLAEQKVIQTRDVVYHFDKFTFAKVLDAGDDRVQEIIDEEAVDNMSESELEVEAALQGGSIVSPSDNRYVEVNDEAPSYDVECIVAQRKRKGAVEYKVRWTG